MRTLTIRVADELHELLHRRAYDDGISKNQVLALALTAYLHDDAEAARLDEIGWSIEEIKQQCNSILDRLAGRVSVTKSAAKPKTTEHLLDELVSEGIIDGYHDGTQTSAAWAASQNPKGGAK